MRAAVEVFVESEAGSALRLDAKLGAGGKSFH